MTSKTLSTMGRGRRLASLLAALAGLALVLAPARVAAQAAAAEALFNQGRDLMQQQKYAEACDKFAASHELDPSVGALLNLGDCREKNGQIASAWAAYREAAATARRTGDPQRERFALQRAERLEGRLAYLVIEVPAEIRVGGLALERNGAPVAEAVWNEKVPVDPGSYVIRATAPGHEAAEIAVKVADGETDARVAVPALVPVPQGAEPAGPSPRQQTGTGALAPEPGSTDMPDTGGGMPTGRKVAIGLGAAGVVGIAAGVVLGLQASSQYDEAKSHCVGGDLDNCDAEGVQLSKDAIGTANLGTVAFSVGVAAAAAGVVLWFLNSPEAGATAEHARAMRVVPLLSPRALGAQATFRF